MFKILLCAGTSAWLCISVGFASVFGTVRGVVHDPQHRPIPGVSISLNAKTSDWTRSTVTDSEGLFLIAAVPVGEYRADASFSGFETMKQDIEVQSGSAPILHFQLRLAEKQELAIVS